MLPGFGVVYIGGSGPQEGKLSEPRKLCRLCVQTQPSGIDSVIALLAIHSGADQGEPFHLEAIGKPLFATAGFATGQPRSLAASALEAALAEVAARAAALPEEQRPREELPELLGHGIKCRPSAAALQPRLQEAEGEALAIAESRGAEFKAAGIQGHLDAARESFSKVCSVVRGLAPLCGHIRAGGAEQELALQSPGISSLSSRPPVAAPLPMPQQEEDKSHAGDGGGVDIAQVTCVNADGAAAPDQLKFSMPARRSVAPSPLSQQAFLEGSIQKPLERMRQQKTELEKQLQAAEQRHGPHHLQVAVTLKSLARTYASLGDARHQKDLLERALGIFERVCGPYSTQVADALVSLSHAHGALGHAQQQKDLLERALRIEEIALGPEHPNVAVTLVNIGNAFERLGDSQQQKSCLQHALRIQEHAFGSDHLKLTAILASLAHLLRRMGDAPQARGLLERALIIKEREFGPESPEVAQVLANLGATCEDLADYVHQKDLMERAFRIFECEYGPSHPHTELARKVLNRIYQPSSHASKHGA